MPQEQASGACGSQRGLLVSEGQIRAVFFDLDGTLVDTESVIYDVWRSAYQDLGLDLALSEWQRNLGSPGAFDPRGQLEALLGRECSDIARRAGNEIAHRCQFLAPRPGAPERVREAKSLGLTVALVSSSDTPWVEEWVLRLGLQREISLLFCGDQVEFRKPAPDLYLLATRSLGLEPWQCLVFEDSPNGARAAVSAGMRCVVVPNDLTRRCEFPRVDMALTSFDQEALGEILRRLGTSDTSGTGSRPRQPTPQPSWSRNLPRLLQSRECDPWGDR